MNQSSGLTDSLRLDDAELFRQQCFVAGRWVDAESNETIDVTNPATNEVIGSVPNMGASESQTAIDAAAGAWSAWRGQTAKHRSVVLRRWFELIVDAREDLSRIMTLEQGKPLAESRAEMAYSASFVEWFADEGRRIYGDTIPSHKNDARIIVSKEPIGVVAAITPWNFPSAMITRKVAPALAAGCPVVVKPAAETPYSALALAVLAERAGLPTGLLSVLTGSATAIGGEMTRNPTVRKLSFTGSTEIGKLLYEQCSGTVKKLSLELGGNAPFIVFDDADINSAVQGALISKFRNNGQTCVCANRILVQYGIYDEFASALHNALQRLEVGDGFSDDTQLGPLIDAKAVTKVEEHVRDALDNGATALCGGKRHSLGGNFFEPTILKHATPEMKVAQEEIFGPVAPLFRFKDEAEAIALANDTEYGLAAYFYGRDIGRIWRVAEALEYGIVGVNEGIISTEVAPFGGVKESGIGREGSKYGIDEFLETKYVLFGGLGS